MCDHPACAAWTLLAVAEARPLWKDPDQAATNAVVRDLKDGSRLRIDFVVLEKFRAGEIQGVIFHCTPLVNKNLEAVETCRRWLDAHGDEPIGQK